MYFRHEAREQSRSVSAVGHSVEHPNGSPANAGWAQDQTLHVVAVYGNPCRWRTRRELFNTFRRHISCLPNVRLYTAELAFGDRPFEVTNRDDPFDFQFRTRDMLWHKENLINQTIERFSPGWEYGAYVDADFTFTRQDVALETVQQLQHYDWVQMFSTYADLDDAHRPIRLMKSFASKFVDGELTPEMIADYGRGGYGRGRTGGVGTTGRASRRAVGCWTPASSGRVIGTWPSAWSACRTTTRTWPR